VAALPQNNTPRIFFDYITGAQATSKEHTVAWRYDGAVLPVPDMQVGFLGFLSALTPNLFVPGWKVLRVRVQEAGALFSLPVGINNFLATFIGTGNAAYAQNREAEEWTWQGRSTTTGRRVDFSLYGLNTVAPPDFRYPVGTPSPAWVGAGVNYLNAFPNTNRPRVIDYTLPVWYQYVNEQNNSYWEEQIRRG